MEKAILLTIITERIMEPTVKELVERAGAQGYTIEDVASGWGKHGTRTGQLESDQTFKMILIVSKSVAHLILQEIERTLQPEYAITAFQHEIEVMSRTPASSGK
jgi:nitrogen regulatory protein PII